MNANILYLKYEIVADTSKTQARIEFRNMAYGTITAVKFEAKGYNAFGDVIQIAGKPTFDIVAQDLVIAPKKYAKLDSVLPSKDIRKLDLKLKQVCYANGKIVNVQPEEIVTYEIEELDENREKLNQQEREERTVLKRRLDEAVCFSKHYGRNWICICGYLNRNTDAICKYCGCREVEMLEEYSKESVAEKVEEKRRKAAVEEAKRKAEQIKFEAEQKRQMEEQERQEAEQKRKRAKQNKIIAGIAGIVVVCSVAGYFVNEKVIVPNNKYNHAVSRMELGQYQEASYEFSALGNYKDASDKAKEATYKNACKLLDEKSYDEAKSAFEALGDYKDSADKVVEVENGKKQEKYDTAMILINQRKYNKAIEILESLGDFSDAADQIKEIYYIKACKLLEQGHYSDAKEEFEKLGDYKDSKEKMTESSYKRACSLWNIRKYDEAIAIFETLDGYKDSNEYLEDYQEQPYPDEIGKLIDEHEYAMGAYFAIKNNDSARLVNRISVECKNYIADTVSKQKLTTNNMSQEKAQELAQTGANSLLNVFNEFRGVLNEEGNKLKKADVLAELSISVIDEYCIPGLIAFESMGDMSQYANGKDYEKGIELTKQTAEAFWNLANLLKDKENITVDYFSTKFSASCSECLNNVNDWINTL